MLTRLEEVGLVDLPPARSTRRFEQFTLLNEDGAGSPYTVPGRSAPVLPAHFYAGGWHLVLEPTEIATYLMVWDMSHRVTAVRRDDSVGVPGSTRRAEYGITDEVYEAHRTLTEFGLLVMEDSIPSRRHGRIDPDRLGGEPSSLVTLRFRVVPDVQHDAHDTVASCLAERAPRYRP
jgi:hypothetical protein